LDIQAIIALANFGDLSAALEIDLYQADDEIYSVSFHSIHFKKRHLCIALYNFMAPFSSTFSVLKGILQKN